MWRIIDYAKLTVVGLLSIGIGLIATSPAYAQGSEVIVQVCDATAMGHLQIVSPESDTVLRESPMQLEGDVELINQVEIYINGAYHKTYAIPRGDVQFSIPVGLQAGTQAVEVRGVGLCNGDSRQDQIVVTYEPSVDPAEPTAPSPGSQVPTVVSPTPGSNGQTSGGVVVSNPNPTEPSDSDSSGWLADFWRRLSSLEWGNRVFRLIDVDTTVQRLPTDWLRVAAFVGGLGLVVGAKTIAGNRLSLWRWLRVVGLVLLLAALLVML